MNVKDLLELKLLISYAIDEAVVNRTNLKWLEHIDSKIDELILHEQDESI